MCNTCHKYSLTLKYKTESEIVVNDNMIISRDCGYGDYDTHCSVQYLVRYSVCPICDNKVEVSHTRLKVLSEYDKYGNSIR